MRCGRDYFPADEDHTQPLNAGTVITTGRNIAHRIAPIVSRSQCERDADVPSRGILLWLRRTNQMSSEMDRPCVAVSAVKLKKKEKVVMTSLAWLRRTKRENGDEDGGPGTIGRQAAAARRNVRPVYTQHKGCRLNIYWLFRSNTAWLMTSMDGQQWFFFSL